MGRCAVWMGIVVCWWCVGCGSPADTTDGTIRLQLNWIPDAQHGGFFAAQELLQEETPPRSLEIRPGSPGTPVLPQLVLGQVDFAIANADQVLLAREQGADIVAVFAALQDSPRCILVHAASDVASIADLHDITLALGEGKAFAEYIKRNSAWRNVRIVAYTGSVARFMSETDFAQQAYVFSEPLVVRQRGGDARCLMVSETGFNPYTSVLVTRRELIEQSPELVRQVVQAVRRGWQHYLDEPDATNARLLELNPDMDATILAQSVAAIGPLCRPENVPIGSVGEMSDARWSTLGGQLRDLGLITAPDEDVKRAYTLEFLD